MTTDLQRYQQPAALVLTDDLPPAAQALTQWATALVSAKQIADALAPTMFCPQGFRGKPEEAAAAILAGAEVGLSPRASLNAFDPIQGTAAPRAITLRAIVQSKGHDVWVVESTATRAIVRGRRAGSEQVHESVWTMDRARGLGLHGKDNWKKQAGAMLVARATAECCRLVAADAILGIPYAAEELDVDDAPAENGQRKRVQRKVKAQVQREAPAAHGSLEAAPAPPLPGDEPDEPPVDSEAAERNRGTVTDAQLKKLHTVFTEAGIKDRDDRLRVASALVHVDLSSSTDLSKEQASDLLNTLDQLEQEGVLAETARSLLSSEDGA